jgi:hypothetical protein
VARPRERPGDLEHGGGWNEPVHAADNGSLGIIFHDP